MLLPTPLELKCVEIFDPPFFFSCNFCLISSLKLHKQHSKTVGIFVFPRKSVLLDRYEGQDRRVCCSSGERGRQTQRTAKSADRRSENHLQGKDETHFGSGGGETKILDHQLIELSILVHFPSSNCIDRYLVTRPLKLDLCRHLRRHRITEI